MKITKLQNGNMLIEFNANEINLINETKSTEQNNTDPFVGMHSHTKAFAKELYFYYGNKEFSIKDEKVFELRKKYFIQEVSKALNKLIENNSINVQYKNSQSLVGKRITKLKFNL